jgi:hypothetical protein
MILMEAVEIKIERLKRTFQVESAEELLSGLYQTLTTTDILVATGKDANGDPISLAQVESLSNIAEMTREIIIEIEKHVEGQGE